MLVINPGSTTTKIAVYENESPLFERSLHHGTAELSRFEKITDQRAFRQKLITDMLSEEGIPLDSIDIIMARGGLIKPVESGVYEVNEAMERDLRSGINGFHASNLGGLIAASVIRENGLTAKAYIADPVVVDEMTPVARVSGHPCFQRLSIFHALNQKAVARNHAKSVNKRYEELNLIVAHLGGGISIGAHEKGRVVDVNNSLDGEGPFSPERAGTVPSGQLIEKCFEEGAEKEEVYRMIVGRGGLAAHLGSNDAKKAMDQAQEGDEHALLIMDAMCYNIGKAIGAQAAVLKGEVDAILITGGMARDRIMCDYIRKMVGFIAEIVIYPGEGEMEALAGNGLSVLRGNVVPKEYR